MAKNTTQETPQPAPIAPHQDNGLAVASMVLGIVSFTGPGLLTGVPAVILGIVALKRGVTERGMSIAGIITGGIATFFTLLFFGVMLLLMIIGLLANNQSGPSSQGTNGSAPSWQPYSQSRT